MQKVLIVVIKIKQSGFTLNNLTFLSKLSPIGRLRMTYDIIIETEIDYLLFPHLSQMKIWAYNDDCDFATLVFDNTFDGD